MCLDFWSWMVSRWTEYLHIFVIDPNIGGCLGGVGWSQTFINHCCYGIFDPFFAENFRLIHGQISLFQGGFTCLNLLSQIKLKPVIFWGGFPNSRACLFHMTLFRRRKRKTKRRTVITRSENCVDPHKKVYFQTSQHKR